jgi:hypothetical protein
MTQNKGRLSAQEWDVFVASIEPTDIDLAFAPLLDDWYPINRYGVTQIFGKVFGHPRHGDGYLTTSEVLRIADDGAWIRTRSRYYKMGKRYEHKPLVELVDEVLSPGTHVPAASHQGWPVREYFPELGPDGGLPPLEHDDTLPKP